MNAVINAASTIDVSEMTIDEAQAGFAEGRFTSESLTRAHLDRIARYEPYYNAFTFMNAAALDEARAIDARRAAGEKLGPLAGIPVVVKEAMDVVGLPSTAGWSGLYSKTGGIDLMPERDAPVVSRLRQAGAIILGRTNIPAFSHDGARANTSWDGPTFNAVDRDICPGASSSGTATAISASFAIVGLAEETGGSIQNPAAAQSLVGIKPTFALVPNTGVAPLAGSARDVVGPHARTVRDAAILLDIIAGYTPEDPKTVAAIGNVPKDGYLSKLDASALEGKRLGLYGAGWRPKPLSEETSQLYGSAQQALRARNAVLVEDPFGGSDFASLAIGEHGFDPRGMESMVYDLEHFLRRLGPGAAARSFAALSGLLPTNPFEGDGPLAVHANDPVIAASLADATVPPDLGKFLAAREAYLQTFCRIMDEYDLDALVFPQTEAAPPGVFESAQYPATTVSEINIAGLPGVTVPAGRYTNGAPFSLIFIGRLWSEASLLAFAYDYEQATNHRIVPQLAETPHANGE